MPTSPRITDGRALTLYNTDNAKSATITCDPNGAVKLTGTGSHVVISSGNNLLFAGANATIGGTNTILTLGQTGDSITFGVDIVGNVNMEGGTLTAYGLKIKHPTGPFTADIITAYGSDVNGMGVYMQSGAAMIVGSGESPSAASANLSATTESLWLTSDTDIKLMSNMQGGYASRKEVVIDSSGRIGIGTTPTEELEIGGTDAKVYLNSATSNMLYFNTNGSAAPAFTTRTNGAKIVLYPAVNGSTVDWAIGMEAGAMWLSAPQNTNAYGIKFYGGTTEVMKIRGDGNVGIGETSPGAKLHIKGAVAGEISTWLENTTTNGYTSIRFREGATNKATIYYFNSTYVKVGAWEPNTLAATGDNVNLAAAGATGIIKFFTGGSADVNEKMRIAADGKVMIGATSATGLLHVQAASSAADVEMLTLKVNSSYSAGKALNIIWRDVTNITSGIGSMFNGTTNTVDMIWHSMYNAGYKAQTDINMTLTGNGKLGIGYTDPTEKLTVNGAISMAKKFKIEYNTTENSLDFVYVG